MKEGGGRGKEVRKEEEGARQEGKRRKEAR